MQANRIAAEGLPVLIWGLVLSSSVFAVSAEYPGTMIEPKWYACAFAAMVGGGLWLAYCCLARRRVFSSAFFMGMEVAVLLVCASQALFMLMTEVGVLPKYGRYAVGSFGNASGFASCMVLSLPVGLRLWTLGGFKTRAFLFACKLLCLSGVLVSGSRIGVLCAIVAALLVFHWRRKAKAFFVAVALFAAVVLVFYVKIGSTKGRWFIIGRTVELIGRHPLFGHGAGGFDANYMDVQADYFAATPNSGYALYAGNVFHPLSEYLLVCVDYGLFGLFVVVSFIVLCIRHSIKRQSYYASLGRNVIVLLCLFSLFSYPMIYPFSWIMLLVGVAAIFNGCFKNHSKVVCVLSFVVALAVSYPMAEYAGARKELRAISDKAAMLNAELMLPRYASLYTRLCDDWRFMYSYAVALYDAGRLVGAMKVADECSALRSDYDLCLLQGYANVQLGEYKNANAFFIRAHHMVPSRFVPLYEMYNVAEERGDTVATAALAHEILAKPVKVPSRETLEMIEEVRRREAERRR